MDSGCPDGSVGDSYHGQLCFVDPRAQVCSSDLRSAERCRCLKARLSGLSHSAGISQGWLHAETLCYRPTPGTMVLFPSWLDHYVTSQKHCDGFRMSIAFNSHIHLPAHKPDPSVPLIFVTPGEHGANRIRITSPRKSTPITLRSDL